MTDIMKVTTSTVFDILSHLRSYFQEDNAIRHNSDEEPLRSELYSSEQMDRHGKVLARSHKLIKGRGHDQLLKRLDGNEKTLLEVHKLLVDNIKSGKTITPGAEWLLDNFYLIEEQMIIARKHLPKGYSEGLPYLAEGTSAGLPRVYDIALEIISHNDGRIDIKGLSNFIAAYQTNTILTLGELWAIPIMLRLGVIENLRRISVKIALDMIDHNLADYWAAKMIETARENPGNLILTIADLARSKPLLLSSFVAAFIRELQGKGPALALPLSWMEQQLAGAGISSSDLVRQENQKQAADQVSVRNSIGSLRLLGSTDWREFVETLSSVESVLRQDSSGTYPLMDFTTRDRYRHVIESVSKASLLSETEVAQKVLELAARENNAAKNKHVGYYLIDKGLDQTAQATGMRYTLKQKMARMAARMPVFIYITSITLLTLITVAAITGVAYLYGHYKPLMLILAGLLSVSCVAQLAVSLVNWLVTIWVKPKLLPRMDFSTGIPASCKTLLVVPTMLSSQSYIEELVEALEIRFLANKEANVYYGLLTDFLDADSETMPGDDALQTAAQIAIEALNQRYDQENEDIFFLFHRPRTWNAAEQKWMGYERKRGKLAALNAFVRGKKPDAFSVVVGDTSVLNELKYIITLDSDTQLPRETVWKFIATMAHPLNHPLYDERKKRVTEGYGILQPRVGSGIPKTARSLYLRMQGDTTGIDPYTRVSSDVYQDLFGEGSFIGKGIYDIDIFEKSVQGVFPENRILSHDLLEGCYARSGLLSDVLLYEDNPSQYSADIKRHHRWIRGDWQIAAWMFPFIPGKNGRLEKNKLSALSRWKIFDNIRRSLLPLSLTLLLMMGWLMLPFPWLWTSVITLIILLPAMVAAGWQLTHKPVDLKLDAHLSEVSLSVRDTLLGFIFSIAVLPYEAYQYTDAIFRTNWRMIVSRKKLLEWTTSASIVPKTNGNVLTAYATMWITPLLGLGSIYLLLYVNAGALYVAWPIITLWILAPAIACQLSRPESSDKATLTETQRLLLHKSARKTWSYFEEFVNETEHWLPPDNYQAQPVEVIAHRTSPTNMGLSLLANLTAYDFGYIAAGELLQRSKDAIETMYRLERYEGHFYNWYNTLLLTPLFPRYVSTVDSGNLCGHLLTLRQGILSLRDAPVFNVRFYDGLDTTVHIMNDLFPKKDTETLEKISRLLDTAKLSDYSVSGIKTTLDELDKLTGDLSGEDVKVTHEQQKWITKLSLQVKSHQLDLSQLVPWTELLPVPDQFPLLKSLNDNASLQMIRDMPGLLLKQIDLYEQQENDVIKKDWLAKIKLSLQAGSNAAATRLLQIHQLEIQCEDLSIVSYDFLFDSSTSLLHIGYNVEEQRKDNSYYDLLASEARLGIFVAIAQGKLPQESWFALGRLLTNSGGDPILLSWSGSMFEYLMPQLVMPVYKNTLLYQTSIATVKRQIEYATQRQVAWGISESAYNMTDANLNYQYRAFGVPGLGLKRGLEEDLVIAPYASMLALMIAPEKACANLQLLTNEGFEGAYGFYEAIDYTASRLPRGKTNSIVYSFMAHHQGMSLLSLAYELLSQPMQRRFMSERRFQATLLLLQERIPRATIFYAHTADMIDAHTATAEVQLRRITSAHTAMPEIQLLSNSRYHVMVTNSGGGYSRWKDIAVTRWREDGIQEANGIFCYIKDIDTGNFWSNTYQPSLHQAKGYEVIYSQGHIEFRRQDHGIDTKTEIVVSPEDDVEMRRIRITNRSQSVRVLEVTSYAEVVMASQASDESHPAFSNLFVQTEIIPQHKAILSTRRPRSEMEKPPWMFHHMNVYGVQVEAVSYETDRMAFVGRGKTLVHPQAMNDEVLSGKQGSVLDPVMSIRHRIRIKPGQTATVDLIFGISEMRAGCENLMHKYRDRHLKNRAFELSWTHNQVLLRQINATPADAQLYDQLAASIIYTNPVLRAAPAVISSNFRGQSGLWSHSVSGDIPIVLLHMYDQENIELVRQMVQAHAYWRLKGLAVDLVIWNEDHGSYRQLLQEQILGLINAETADHLITNKPGNIFVKSINQISAEDRVLFESVAHVIISDSRGTLAEQVNQHLIEKVLPPLLEHKSIVPQLSQHTLALPEDLLFFNGKGGFTADGKEYKIITDKENATPAPWVNVIANPDFGTVISESGSAYTWAMNAHEYRITPWNNNPVSDTGGEAFYLRDEESGHFWSPTPFPKKSEQPYLTTHGHGYSSFEHIEQDIYSEMTVFVDKDLPVKFIVLKIKNQSGRERKLSATGFLEMILGDVRSKTNRHIVSEYDTESKALFFRNRYNTTFAERISFFKTDGATLSFTTDRTEFIGRNRNLENPQALYRKKLSGNTGAGIDPCAALQIKFDLLDSGEKEIIFLIGSDADTSAARRLIWKFTDSDAVAQALEQVKEYWIQTTTAIQIKTPDEGLNILTNSWLIYQTLACRVFARSGFYQSGGAFGFRDQLQDVLALLHTKPNIAREQILLSASRQFPEGDVQHWWHPPEGRGVRTHCSDDLLWLPFVVAKYITATGDKEILSVPIGFIEGRQLHPGEDSLFDLPAVGNITASLYDHCVRAINHSLRSGVHGLPLIGSGDWNDGMDQVGNKGQGESVWLAFFLYSILSDFSVIADEYGDAAFVSVCQKAAFTLQSNIETYGWDGEWYLRAYFDDGTPLGSKENSECRIDAIAQSWSVLSGAANDKRKTMAMNSLDKYLVKRDFKLIQLLHPPFNNSKLNPGYIKGYMPGVRENGGQYSHAAIWALMAFAALGDREKVWELCKMIQPISHSSDKESSAIYKVEPYVMAADVYMAEMHRGRGGWTWYTGSAGWMYQFILNSLLGIIRTGDQLSFNPCFPFNWPSVAVDYCFGKSVYHITIFQSTEITETYREIDGVKEMGKSIRLTDDGNEHNVEVFVLIISAQ